MRTLRRTALGAAPVWRGRGCQGLLLGVCLAMLAGNAFAQVRPARKPPARELDLGLTWTGRTPYGSADANLTTGSGGTRPLFSTTSEMGPGAAIEAHLGFQLTRHLGAEASGSWQRSELRTRTSADFEGAEPATLTEPVSSFTAAASGVWSLRPRKKCEPFLHGGAGWMRELTEGGVLASDSLVVSVGGGVKYWWRQGFGLRSEVRAVIRSGGLELAGSSRRVSPAVGVSAAFRF